MSVCAKFAKIGSISSLVSTLLPAIDWNAEVNLPKSPWFVALACESGLMESN